VPKLTLEIVVNGTPTQVESNPEAPLLTVVPIALQQTNNVGQPPDNWELRDSSGNLLDLHAKIESFGFGAGVRLFLNLKAGIGG